MTEEISRVIVEVNDKKAGEKIESLQKKAEDLRKKLQEAIELKDQKAIDNITKKLKATGQQIDQVRSKADKVKAAMRNLDAATPKQLKETIKAITSELNSGKIARGSKEWDAYVTKLKAAKTELAKLQAEMNLTTTKATRLRDTVNSWGASVAAGIGAFTGVILTGRKAVQAFADIDTAMANTRKFTGMTAEQVEGLNEEFKKLDTRVSREELNLLAQEAGRLGKTSKEDILGYVKASQILNVALSDLGEGATQSIAKLNNIFKVEEEYGIYDSMVKIGSVINVLSQNCTASKPYLVEFANRLAGVGSQAGMTLQQIIGLGAVLDSNAQKVEASSTAVTQVLTRMYKDPAKYAKVAGLEVKSFAELLKKDANEALLTLLAALDKAGNMDAIAPMLGEMGEAGARVTNTLSTLAKHIEEVRAQQQTANKAFEEGTSVGNEFEIQNNTVQAQLDKAKKGFAEMAIALGQELVPAMKHCITGSSALMRVMLSLINFVKEHKGAIAALVSAYFTYNAYLLIANGRLKALIVSNTLYTKGVKLTNGLLTIMKVLFAGATNAVQYFTNGLNVNYSMQERWRVATSKARAVFASFNPAVMAIVGTLGLLATAYKVLKSRTDEVNAVTKMTNEIEANAAAKTEDRRKKLLKLVSVAENETESLNNRKKAIAELNGIIPDYNARLDETSGKYTANKKALDDYISSLKKKYELEGAKGKLAEIGRERVDLAEKKSGLKTQLAEHNENAAKAQQAASMAAGGSITGANLSGAVGGSAEIIAARLKDKIAEIEKQEDILARKEQRLVDLFGNDIYLTDMPEITDTQTESSGGGGGGVGNVDDEAKKAKAEMLLVIAEIQALRDQSLAENKAMYAAGLKDYRQYVTDEHNILLDAVRDEKKVYEDRNLRTTKDYSALIKEELDMLNSFTKTKRELSLEDIENEKKDRQNFLLLAYSTPKSAMFGNDAALKQQMFESDIEYLEKKRNIYGKFSAEYEQISLQIEQRLAEDKLQKQKELAESYQEWVKKYEDMSGSEREQKELDTLKALYDAKLISEENYQEAVKAIRERNMREDQERNRKTQSQYADMLLNVSNSFKTLFEDIKDGGKFSFDNLSKAAESAFAVMGSITQAYSALNNAEQDAEVAKVERRYDKEIAAAGNNKKKIQKLEKEKEENIAKTKNKYAKRQQAVEIASAIANTAIAALNAYSSAANIPMVGHIIAPIAAAMATAFGMMQVATIKKQYEANQGYYSGGFTRKDPNNRREVGVVHANEFVANHEAVENAALSPVLRLIDYAQRNNSVASLTSTDVSNALGQGSGVSARGAVLSSAPVVVQAPQVAASNQNEELFAKVSDSIDRLNRSIENGIESYTVLDGERGLANRLDNYNRLSNNSKRSKR